MLLEEDLLTTLSQFLCGSMCQLHRRLNHGQQPDYATCQYSPPSSGGIIRNKYYAYSNRTISGPKSFSRVRELIIGSQRTVIPWLLLSAISRLFWGALKIVSGARGLRRFYGHEKARNRETRVPLISPCSSALHTSHVSITSQWICVSAGGMLFIRPQQRLGQPIKSFIIDSCQTGGFLI